jgi:hypothetical protein
VRTNQTHILIVKHLDIVAMQGKSWSAKVFERVFILHVVMMILIVIRFFLLDFLVCHQGEIKTLLAH